MRLLFLLILLFQTVGASAATSDADNAYRYQFTTLEGKPMPLSQFDGKVLLIVNTASQCGLSNQLTGLQKLHDTYKSKGLVIIGVPSNDFGGQEPGDAKTIAQYAKGQHHVDFILGAGLDKVITFPFFELF